MLSLPHTGKGVQQKPSGAICIWEKTDPFHGLGKRQFGIGGWDSRVSPWNWLSGKIQNWQRNSFTSLVLFMGCPRIDGSVFCWMVAKWMATVSPVAAGTSTHPPWSSSALGFYDHTVLHPWKKRLVDGHFLLYWLSTRLQHRLTGWSGSRSMGEKELEAFGFMHDLFMQIKLWNGMTKECPSALPSALDFLKGGWGKGFGLTLGSSNYLHVSFGVNSAWNQLPWTGMATCWWVKILEGNFKWASGKDQPLEVTIPSGLSSTPRGTVFLKEQRLPPHFHQEGKNCSPTLP